MFLFLDTLIAVHDADTLTYIFVLFLLSDKYLDVWRTQIMFTRKKVFLMYCIGLAAQATSKKIGWLARIWRLRISVVFSCSCNFLGSVV